MPLPAHPSPFITAWLPRVASWLPPNPRALDLAMGRGRHVPALSAAGFTIVGVDVSLDAVQTAVHAARLAGTPLRAFCADMTRQPLPRGWFDLVLVSRYLDRPRLPDLKAAVAPGGCVIYETFTRNQRRLGRGPTSPDHLLEPGELVRGFEDFELIFAEETTAPDALARLVARRR